MTNLDRASDDWGSKIGCDETDDVSLVGQAKNHLAPFKFHVLRAAPRSAPGRPPFGPAAAPLAGRERAGSGPGAGRGGPGERAGSGPGRPREL